MNPALPGIYLVRHGDTAGTLTPQHTRRIDLPLSERGERQVRELGANLTGLRFGRILSSPLQHARRVAELAMPRSMVEADDDVMQWDYRAYEGRSTVAIKVERPGGRLLRDGSSGSEALDAVGPRADRVIGRLRAGGGNVRLFGHREILRILAVCWIGLAPIDGRRLLLDTASVSVPGYDHDLSEPVIHAWNGRGT